MDLFAFIDRGVKANAPQRHAVAMLDTTADVVAEMMGITLEEFERVAPQHPLLESLGSGVYRVWSGRR